MIFSLVTKRTMGSQPMALSPAKKNDYIMTANQRPNPVRRVEPPVAPNTIHVIAAPSIRKSMKWGEPVWFFLHTIAHKVKDESFVTVRADLLKHIYTICTNLPCPDCSLHAKNYLMGINFNNIRNKMDLKNMLFDFHNSVNRRKGFVDFSREQLDIKYEQANFIAISNYFIKVFLDKHASPRMIADDIYRARLTYVIRDWLISNMTHFDK
jgi:hypothetical protein